MSTETNETADLIRDAIGPQLGEFLDGYVLCGIKAGTRKKIIVVKMPKKVAASVEEYNKDGVPMGKDIDGYDHDMKPIRDTGKELRFMVKTAERWGDAQIAGLCDKWMLEWSPKDKQYHISQEGDTTYEMRDGQLVESTGEGWMTLGYCDTYEEVVRWSDSLRPLLGATNTYFEEP